MTAPQTAEQTLVAWLAARLDEDEAAARATLTDFGRGSTDAAWRADGYAVVSGASWAIVSEGNHENCEGGASSPVIAQHIARHDPARVLADVAAKRRIVELHSAPYTWDVRDVTYRYTDRCACREVYPCPTLRALAAPYSSIEGFREEWSV